MVKRCCYNCKGLKSKQYDYELDGCVDLHWFCMNQDEYDLGEMTEELDMLFSKVTDCPYYECVVKKDDD